MNQLPTIVCLCGSVRFYKAFQRANYVETLAGRIVLTVGHYPDAPDDAHGETVGVTPDQKVKLDELHLRKIDLASEILVLNVNGYVGQSTAREIAWAVATGKRVRYLEDRGIADPQVSDRIGIMIEDFRKGRHVTDPSIVALHEDLGPVPAFDPSSVQHRLATNAAYGKDERHVPYPEQIGNDPLLAESASKEAVRDARRCYDLYLRAFTTTRNGAQFEHVVTEEQENELGFALVLKHRKAVLAGVIDGTDVGTFVGTFGGAGESRPRRMTPRSPQEVWAWVLLGTEDSDWSFLDDRDNSSASGGAVQ